MILGHFAVASIAKQTYFHRETWAFLALASVFPDILDKPANILLGLPGRGAGHSLVVLTAVTLLVWILSPKLKSSPILLVAGTIMWVSHLAGDFVKLEVLLWPFLGPLEPTPPFDIWEKVHQFYVVRASPEQFWLEAICVTAALGLWAVRFFAPRSAKDLPTCNSGNGRGK
jgi:membrane-bound metal-dependent hydrolase YbcI (DUF457 family)